MKLTPELVSVFEEAASICDGKVYRKKLDNGRTCIGISGSEYVDIISACICMGLTITGATNGPPGQVYFPFYQD